MAKKNAGPKVAELSGLGKAAAASQERKEGVTGSGAALSPGDFRPRGTPTPVAQVTLGAKPDLLYHPYKAYLREHGLEDFFAARDQVELHMARGWKVFHRPNSVPDENVVFHSGSGDLVMRGDLILMVRPVEIGEAERAANLAAHKQEISDIAADLIQEKAPALGTTAEKVMQLRPAPPVAPAPVDELG